MTNDLIINNIKPQDEYYTPRIMVNMIIPYINKKYVICCVA